MATSSTWQAALSESTSLSLVTVVNYLRSLRDAGLYTRPSRGGAHKSSQVTAAEYANSILGLAAYQASEAPDAVQALRNCAYSCSLPASLEQKPLIDGDDYGVALDGMIEGIAHTLDHANGGATNENIIERSLPHQIEMQFYPSEIKMTWLDNIGAIKRVDVYSQKSGEYGGRTLFRRTFIHPDLVWLAGRMLHDTPDRTDLLIGNVATTTTPKNKKAAGAPPPNGLPAKSKQAAKPAPVTAEQTTHTPTSGQSRRVRGLPSSPFAER